MPMKDDLRRATDAVLSLYGRGEKEDCIDRCDLSPEDADILKRVWVRRQSRVEIAMALNMDVRTVDRHYRRGMLMLACMIGRQK